MVLKIPPKLFSPLGSKTNGAVLFIDSIDSFTFCYFYLLDESIIKCNFDVSCYGMAEVATSNKYTRIAHINYIHNYI